MEDMSFDKSNQITSNVAINLTNNKAYFMLYTDDDSTGVDLTSNAICYYCVHTDTYGDYSYVGILSPLMLIMNLTVGSSLILIVQKY